MSARRPLVAGNWKMHGSLAANESLIDGVLRDLPLHPEARVAEGGVEVVVCPTFVHLAQAAGALRGSPIGLGAQNVCAEVGPGAFTGEVSAAMLRELGCSHVIIGHSERRALFGESDADVVRKVSSVVQTDLVPILCVGETLAERDAGTTHEVIARQLEAVLEGCGVGRLGRLVVAYEPVWAIGTGRTATPAQAEDAHAFIRGRIGARDAKLAGSVRILYGGSVKAGNARELFAMPNVDGGLIGGASLKADEFVAIVAAAAQD